MERMEELDLFKNKIKYFDLHEKHKFDENSRLLIAVPGLNLKTVDGCVFTIEKEIKEAEMFAEHIRKTIGAETLILEEIDKIDEILNDKPIDCLIDLHELHSRQRDIIMKKIKGSDEPLHSKFIALYP